MVGVLAWLSGSKKGSEGPDGWGRTDQRPQGRKVQGWQEGLCVEKWDLRGRAGLTQRRTIMECKEGLDVGDL